MKAAGLVEDEDDTPELMDDDLGLYYPFEYGFHTWNEKRNHGLLPEPGGINDQDWRLVYHDWPAITKRYNQLYRRMKDPGFALPDTANDWTDL